MAIMEDIAMFIRKNAASLAGRTAALATAATLALTAIGPSTAVAGEFSHGKSASMAAGNLTDVSARRRGHVGHAGGAAAAAAFAGIVGTGIAIAASQNRRGYYDDGPGYYAPRPYYSQPYYGGYGQQPYYGGGYRGW
jgi:hypothetical protein